jgi:hypothetical protein
MESSRLPAQGEDDNDQKGSRPHPDGNGNDWKSSRPLHPLANGISLRLQST